MNGKNLENELIGHCAPTLAGLKSANLFRYFYTDRKTAEREIATVNRLLNSRGVYVEALHWKENSILIYAYRVSHLQRELSDLKAKELLITYGYDQFDVESCISHLRDRLKDFDCFPHEIGIFLGYPLEDVKGFIENGGKNCKCCGMWKVYCDEKAKVQLFHKFQRCTDIYQQVFSEGRNLVQMTVCA